MHVILSFRGKREGVEGCVVFGGMGGDLGGMLT